MEDPRSIHPEKLNRNQKKLKLNKAHRFDSSEPSSSSLLVPNPILPDDQQTGIVLIIYSTVLPYDWVFPRKDSNSFSHFFEFLFSAKIINNMQRLQLKDE